jgi:transcriptional regulator with XRE-family HTH domain
MSSWFRSTPESEAMLAEERLVVVATEAIHEAMELRGISKRELAGKLGVRRSEISQRLSGRRNMTLRSLAAVLHALGVRAKLSLEPADKPYIAGVQWNSTGAMSVPDSIKVVGTLTQIAIYCDAPFSGNASMKRPASLQPQWEIEGSPSRAQWTNWEPADVPCQAQ